MPVTIINHPIAKVQLSVLRAKSTPAATFRATLDRLSTLIAIEASKDLPLAQVAAETPFGAFAADVPASTVGLAPILRSGLGMENALLSYLPDAKVYHIGLFRDQHSLQPVEYYSRLPKSVTVDTMYILDPLLATGNTAIAAVNMVTEWGLPVRSIKFLAVLASQEAIDSISQSFPDLEVVVAAVDAELSSGGYVVPGCGDVGDRLYSSAY